MSEGITSGATTIPISGSQPVQIATPATATSLVLYTGSVNAGLIYIGGPTVTTATGLPLPADSYLAVDIGDVGSVYLAGTQNDTVRWLATGRVLPA